MKDVIVTGLRVNNDFTLGNYLGAMLPMVQLQEKYAGRMQLNMFIPDLHSFSTPVDHAKLYNQSIEAVKMFIAAGLDPSDENTYIYRQSRVPAHSELAIILGNFTYLGELNRQIQFKDKSAKGQNVSAGLYNYPILMAADILLYGAKYVPVGADQSQHVELARDIAIRFNNKFGDVLSPPEPESEQVKFIGQQERLRIKDLTDPSKKMSKSDQTGKGVIFLNDSPNEARNKIMSAATDSVGSVKYDLEKQPGISNLLTILSGLRGNTHEELLAEFEGETNYGNFKKVVADEVATFLEEFQAKIKSISDNAVEDVLVESEKSVNEHALSLLRDVQKAIGLRQ